MLFRSAGATACIAFNDLIAIGMLTRLRERGVRVPQDMSVVGCDDIFGADFCNPPLTTMTSPIERAGRVAKRLGVRVARIGPHAPFVDSGAAAADAAVNAGATACIAFNDLIAIGMLTRLRERGVRVPEDMSVVGCDDIFGADFCNPPLTTMTSPIERAGRVAIRMLLGRLGAAPSASGDDLPDGHAAGAVALPTHLTVRESTGPAPTSPHRPS